MTRAWQGVVVAALVVGAGAVWLILRHGTTEPRREPAQPLPRAQGTEQTPADPLEAGLRLEAQGRADDAEALYPQAMEADTSRALDAGRQIAPNADVAKTDGPLREFHAGLKRDAQTVRTHRTVTSAIADGRLDRAAGLYAQAWGTNPGYARLLLRLLERLQETGYVQEAGADLLARLAAEPARPETHRDVAAVMYAVGDYPQAWEHVHECQRLNIAIDDAFLSALTAKMPEPRETQPTRRTDP